MTVSITDVARTLGRSAPSRSSAQGCQWALWIEDARLLIQDRLGNLDDLNQANLEYVVREAVAERVRNTRDERSSSKTVKADDGEVTTRWEEGQDTQLFITDAWWALLSPADDARGSFTIRPYTVPPRCRP